MFRGQQWGASLCFVDSNGSEFLFHGIHYIVGIFHSTWKMTYPEWAVRDGDFAPGDGDGVLDVLGWHVLAPVGSIMIVLNDHVNWLVVSIHACDGQWCLASATGINREFCPFVDSDTSLLQTWASGNHLKNRWAQEMSSEILPANLYRTCVINIYTHIQCHKNKMTKSFET